jgi:DNA-binding CsgD family transcriptional regulator
MARPENTVAGMALSPREKMVLEEAMKGQSGKEMAHSLGISEQTVKNHMYSIMIKLSARDRTHAVVIYMSQREPEARAIRQIEEIEQGLRRLNDMINQTGAIWKATRREIDE